MRDIAQFKTRATPGKYFKFVPLLFLAIAGVLYGIAAFLPLALAVPFFILVALFLYKGLRMFLSCYDKLPSLSADATPNEFKIERHHIGVKLTGAPRISLLTTPMTKSAAIWYLKIVKSNCMLNNFARMIRFGHLWFARYIAPLPSIHPQASYYFVLNTSLYRWIQDNGHAVYPNVQMPSGRRGRMGGAGKKFFKQITVNLNHEKEIVESISMDGDLVIDTEDVMVILGCLLGVYCHPQVHVVAAEVGTCATVWPLAEQANWAVQGLNNAAVTVDFCVFPGWCQAAYEHGHAGVPHPKNNAATILLEKSGNYRCALEAHRDPLIRKCGENNPKKIAAIIQSSLCHGFDHYLLDIFMPPLFVESSYLDIDITFLCNYVLTYNNDFNSNFEKPCDEVTQRLREIVKTKAPELLDGWQWAVAE